MESTEGCEPLGALPISSIDVVVCNAGVLTNDDFSSLSFSDCAWQFNTNALGPLRAVQALLPKLKDGSKVVFVGSKLGSFGECAPGKRVRCWPQPLPSSSLCRARAEALPSELHNTASQLPRASLLLLQPSPLNGPAVQICACSRICGAVSRDTIYR